MKLFAIAALTAVALVGVFAGHAAAQGPAPNGVVTTQASGEMETAVDGDDTCQFIGPFRALIGLPISDIITVNCSNVNASHTFSANYKVKLGQTVSGSFTSNNHTIDWTFGHPSNPTYTWDIALDGVHYTGVF